MSPALGQHHSWRPCELCNRARVCFCLCMSLGSFLFDLCSTLFHIYHFPSITDVVCIHYDGLPPIYSPLWDALVYALPPMYYYIRGPLLAL
jgi:hypothetical protein